MAQVDEPAWQLLAVAVSAAHRGDPGAFASTTVDLTRVLDLERQRVAGLYVVYLLRYALANAVGGHRPEGHELTRLASEHRDGFVSLLQRAEPDLLERTLLTAYKLVPAKEEVEGALFSLAATAALGILLKDPASDLNTMRPHLTAWLDRHREDIQRMVRAQ